MQKIEDCCAAQAYNFTLKVLKIGQNHMIAPCMTIYLVISLPKTPYMYMVLADPKRVTSVPKDELSTKKGAKQSCT
jgi:hypothetical protein